jgi:hypothetical protein
MRGYWNACGSSNSRCFQPACDTNTQSGI